MSHFQTVVLLPPRIRNPRAHICRLLAPYQEHEANPHSEWDWWRIGGRWDGKMKYGHERPSDDGGYYFAPAHEQREHNLCPVADIRQSEPPFAVVTPYGAWYERGVTGWPVFLSRLCARHGDRLRRPGATDRRPNLAMRKADEARLRTRR